MFHHDKGTLYQPGYRVLGETENVIFKMFKPALRKANELMYSLSKLPSHIHNVEYNQLILFSRLDKIIGIVCFISFHFIKKGISSECHSMSWNAFLWPTIQTCHVFIVTWNGKHNLHDSGGKWGLVVIETISAWNYRQPCTSVLDQDVATGELLLFVQPFAAMQTCSLGGKCKKKGKKKKPKKTVLLMSVH